jgi:acyl-CoA synthetase (NDP forming)
VSASIRQSPLYAILNPRQVAIFGASNRFTSMGTNLLSSLKALGFEGKVYPVHPTESEVLGYRSYPDVAELPEVPDLALIVLPTHLVPDVLADCGRKGIRHAIIVSGGFKEVGADGRALEQRLIDVARQFRIRFLGPNCIGVANAHHRLNVTFLPHDAQPGFIGMASQSGSFITQMFDYLAGFHLGFSAGISVGNEADIDIVDCLEYFADCPNTRVIGLYIESIRRGRTFVETARKITPFKPVVAYYVGGSEAGRKAGLSHTGALAGPDSLYNGAFRQSGVIRATSMTELFDYCWALGSCPPIKGRKIAVQTHSGGPGAAAADALSRCGLALSVFSQVTLDRLRKFVPPTGSVDNPVDLTFTKNPLDYMNAVPDVLLEDEGVDGLLAYFLMPIQGISRALEHMGASKEEMDAQIEKMLAEMVGAVAGQAGKYRKPLIGFSYRDRGEPFLQALFRRSVPVLPNPERAARAMAALVRYREYRRKFSPAADGPDGR